MRSRHASFKRGLRPASGAAIPGNDRPRPEATNEISSSKVAASQLDRAKALADEQQWLPALEIWSELMPRVDKATRRELIANRWHALESLGEWYLSEREVRGRLPFDADPQVRQAAFEHLRRVYEQSEDLDSLEELLCAAVVADPSVDRLGQLADTLWQRQMD